MLHSFPGSHFHTSGYRWVVASSCGGCDAATGKFKEAAEHALKCYEFYLDGEQGRQDTDALTMYGTF